MGFEGDTPPSSDRTDIVPNGYIISLKPYLAPTEADAHCAKIRELCSPAATALDEGAGGEPSAFFTFGMGPEGVATDTVDDSTPRDTLRGYTGIFTPEVLQTIQQSNEVPLSPAQAQMIGTYLIL
jgi:hypothetical protein